MQQKTMYNTDVLKISNLLGLATGRELSQKLCHHLESRSITDSLSRHKYTWNESEMNYYLP